ncbi:MAG: bifunctional biotin--[acetyl-CoA-carboxylase] synthetase/biotin operon repressor, partial [Anaerolineae bacterium]
FANVVGHPVERGDFLRAVVEGIARRYADLRAGVSPVREWEAALDTIGQDVVVELPGEHIAGVAVGVDADGALLVRTQDGVRRVVAGDVRVRTPHVAP